MVSIKGKIAFSQDLNPFPSQPVINSLVLCALCVLCGLFFPLSADPWGKDADLARSPSCSTASSSPHSTSFLNGWGVRMIKFHQQVISPADGPRSHYYPCSSQYAINAIRKYGFCKGVMMGCDRLMRENDEEWVYRSRKDSLGKPIKYDPVP